MNYREQYTQLYDRASQLRRELEDINDEIAHIRPLAEAEGLAEYGFTPGLELTITPEFSHEIEVVRGWTHNHKWGIGRTLYILSVAEDGTFRVTDELKVGTSTGGVSVAQIKAMRTAYLEGTNNEA